MQSQCCSDKKVLIKTNSNNNHNEWICVEKETIFRRPLYLLNQPINYINTFEIVSIAALKM